MKKFLMAMMAMTVILSLTGLAQAKPYHILRTYDSGGIVSHPAGCPWSAFCGCGVSTRVFGHPVRNLYLASNWYHFPRTYVHAGAVAVRNHHVFYIEESYGDGTVKAYDPNSGGHQTREHRVSLAGYTIVDPNGGGYSHEEATSHHLRHYAMHYRRHYRGHRYARLSAR